jgi:hypothetical protein
MTPRIMRLRLTFRSLKIVSIPARHACGRKAPYL